MEFSLHPLQHGVYVLIVPFPWLYNLCVKLKSFFTIVINACKDDLRIGSFYFSRYVLQVRFAHFLCV